MDELTVRDDREFRRFVRAALEMIREQNAESRGELKNVVARLDTLNGSVARHEAAIGELKLKQSVDEAQEVTRAKVSQEWWDRLKPVVYLILGLLIALLLEHGPDLVKVKMGG